MTIKETIERHRKEGRGRKAFLIAAALMLVVTAVCLAPARAGRRDQSRHGGDRGIVDRLMPGEAAAKLRRHTQLSALAGLSESQVERIAEIVDRAGPALERFDSRRAGLTARAAQALAADAIDLEKLASVEEEAKQLAAAVIRESFGLMAAVAAELTPEQRERLSEEWESRR